MLFVMYILKLFKRDVLVSGRYKRSFECLDNGVIGIIDYKNGMVDGIFKVCGGMMNIDNGKLKQIIDDFHDNTVEYMLFSKNIMILNYHLYEYCYYVGGLTFLHNDDFSEIFKNDNSNSISKK